MRRLPGTSRLVHMQVSGTSVQPMWRAATAGKLCIQVGCECEDGAGYIVLIDRVLIDHELWSSSLVAAMISSRELRSTVVAPA